jgi:flagellar biosynthesis/type III secretory pathway protein FliH
VTGSARLPLFIEDFDNPAGSAPAPEPEIIEPVFTAAEIAAARATAWREGYDAATVEWGSDNVAAIRRSLAAIATQCAAAREEAAAVAETSAEAVAQLLFDCFAKAFPALSARHGETELRAIVREVLPALRQEPKVTIRLNRHDADGVAAEIGRMDPELAEHVQIVPTDSMVAGDLLITWRNGRLTRDAAAVWRNIADILAPAGLLPAQPAMKEPERVE